MIFETKKSKIIREQKERIEHLENLLCIQDFGRSKIIEQRNKVVTLRCAQVLEPGMPVEVAKNIIVSKMGSMIKDFVTFEILDTNWNEAPAVLIKGTVNVTESEDKE